MGSAEQQRDVYIINKENMKKYIILSCGVFSKPPFPLEWLKRLSEYRDFDICEITVHIVISHSLQN